MKVKVQLEPGLAQRVIRDVAAGRATSVDAWLLEAARAKVRSDDLTSLLTDLLEHTGGPLTEHEILNAREHVVAGEDW